MKEIIIFPQHNELCQGKYKLKIPDDVEDIDEYLYEKGIDYSYYEDV